MTNATPSTIPALSVTGPAFSAAADLIGRETSAAVSAIDPEAAARVAALVLRAARVFVVGAGRSGLALHMVAMRLMHLGLAVHVAGEVTAPAIAAGDLLLAVSGSGTTASVLHAAEVAKRVGAHIAVLTTATDSPLATAADVVLHIAAAAKLDRTATASRQYAGSLFEQTVLLAGDALFQAIIQARGIDAATLWARHANLE